MLSGKSRHGIITPLIALTLATILTVATGGL